MTAEEEEEEEVISHPTKAGSLPFGKLILHSPLRPPRGERGTASLLKIAGLTTDRGSASATTNQWNDRAFANDEASVRDEAGEWKSNRPPQHGELCGEQEQ
jgi:hypothetical protein